MARKPENNNIRKLKGEKNKDRFLPDVNVDLLDQIPEAPDFLDVDGVRMFERVASYLITHKVLTTLDIDHLAFTVDLAVQIRNMRKAGINPPTSMYTTWKSFASDLYLNPVARQKMMGGVSDSDSPYSGKKRPKK